MTARLNSLPLPLVGEGQGEGTQGKAETVTSPILEV